MSKLSKGLDAISAAIKRVESGASPEDVTYIICWLAFEASLLVRGGRYTNEAAKVNVERALKSVETLTKRLA